MTIPVFFTLHWYVAYFLQALFHHRYAAHNHVTMSAISEKMFFICCFLVHGSSYMSPYVYGIMHRVHHKHADEPLDPHSPHIEPNFFRLMLLTRNNYQKFFHSKIIVGESMKKNLPEWNSFEKLVHNWFTRSCWIIGYTCIYIVFATDWWMFLLLPITISMAAFQGNVVNWWAHKFGYSNYRLANSSKNMMPVDVFFIGDAYHNNHHKFPGKVKNSHRWFETDLIFHIMNCMHYLHIIRWKNHKSI
jgi:stearoyl-CoA desaturase (delta-9 desaturase)